MPTLHLPRHLSFLLTLLRKTNLKTEHLDILLRLSQIDETQVFGLAKGMRKNRVQVKKALLFLQDKGLVTYTPGSVSPRKRSRVSLAAPGLALLKRL